MKLKTDVSRQHDENNLASARLILADVTKYGGEGSGLVAWAKAVTERLEGTNDGNR